jgi:hypothetical protein
MDELIERLRSLCVDYDGSQMQDGEFPMPGVTAGLLREAAAALEAAREDGLRLEWLADNIHMIAKCGGLWFSSDGAGPYQDRTLRGAIDHARGKAGQEVGK